MAVFLCYLHARGARCGSGCGPSASVMGGRSYFVLGVGLILFGIICFIIADVFQLGSPPACLRDSDLVMGSGLSDLVMGSALKKFFNR